MYGNRAKDDSGPGQPKKRKLYWRQTLRKGSINLIHIKFFFLWIFFWDFDPTSTTKTAMLRSDFLLISSFDCANCCFFPYIYIYIFLLAAAVVVVSSPAIWIDSDRIGLRSIIDVGERDCPRVWSQSASVVLVPSLSNHTLPDLVYLVALDYNLLRILFITN